MTTGRINQVSAQPPPACAAGYNQTLHTGWTRRYYTFSTCATIATIHRTIGAMYCEEQFDAPQPYNADSERTCVLFNVTLATHVPIITNRSSTLDAGWTRRYYTISICATITTIHRTIGAMYCEEQYTN